MIGLFHAMFWREKMGINTAMFQLLQTGLLVYLYPASFKRANVQATTLLTLVATAMVIWHNSFISKFAYFNSLLLMVAFVHEPELKSIVYACAHSLHQILHTFAKGLQRITQLPKTTGVLGNASVLLNRHVKLVMIPIAIFCIFFAIFKAANPVFDQLTNQGFDYLGRWLSSFTFDIYVPWLFFLFFGAWATGFIIFNWYKKDMLQREQTQQDQLYRVKTPRQSTALFHLASLRQEYKIGLITVAMVNVLLLVINAIDVQFIWFNFDYGKAGNLKAMVHKGTYLLIFSIVLSMGILLYFFRRNLNFYPQNHRLKKLAYVWLVQNAILVVSVALRTMYYIEAKGLAYKRIGVLIFLCLTMFGLFTMFRKIDQRKSAYYLWKHNSWAVYVMMVAMSLFNWDRMIVQHNYAHYGQLSSFTIERSVRTLDLLHQYSAQATQGHKSYLKYRIHGFQHEQESYSWLSWNYADWRVKQYFKAKKE